MTRFEYLTYYAVISLMATSVAGVGMVWKLNKSDGRQR